MHDLDLTEEIVDIPGIVRIAGKTIARNVAYEEFLEADYGERHIEWVNGVVIKMPLSDERHDALVQCLRILFKIYLELTNGGRVLGDPMLMKLESVPSSRARHSDIAPRKIASTQEKSGYWAGQSGG
jgi:Uma2 family endonuclease